MSDADISEYALEWEYPGVLDILLKDRTTGGNIRWCTDSYGQLAGEYPDAKFGAGDEMTIESIAPNITSLGPMFGKPELCPRIISPRCRKTREEQTRRVKNKAEVFTPTWVCNKQNNIVDEAWFGKNGVFNVEDDKTHTHAVTDWEATPPPFEALKEGHFIYDGGSTRTWKDYVLDRRLEITCGEGPYLFGRYDVITGSVIDDVNARVGLLDRKLRVVTHFAKDERAWNAWARLALTATYGFEWQGDNLLLAREAAFQTFLDFHKAAFPNAKLKPQTWRSAAEIISWNLWQMDGLKFTVPETDVPCKVRVWETNPKHKPDGTEVLFRDSMPGQATLDI